MKNNIVELPSEYEEMINKLESQITELFSEINYYQALVTEKENTIIRLTTENRYLKAKIQDASSELTPPPQPHQLHPPSTPSQESYTPSTPSQPLNPPSYPSQESFTPLPSTPQQLNPPTYVNQEASTSSISLPLTEPPTPPNEDTRVNKRVCPDCGAMGFAIKEVNDRTRIISYNPQRIYAKKKVCTKCRKEWY